jgi:hypothetical protein
LTAAIRNEYVVPLASPSNVVVVAVDWSSPIVVQLEPSTEMSMT